MALQCEEARERFRLFYAAPSQTAVTLPVDARTAGVRAVFSEAYEQRLPELKAKSLGPGAPPPLWWKLRAADGGELWYRDDGIACGVEEAIFTSDLEAAQDLVGAEIWSQRLQALEAEPGPAVGRHLATGREARAADRLAVESVSWNCDPDHPYLYRLARGGEFVGYYKASRPAQLAKDFFLVDPRTRHPDWTERDWEAIRKGEVHPGMTMEMVKASLGAPNKIKHGFEKKNPGEFWYYQTGPNEFRRLAFQDGKLVSSGIDSSQVFREGGGALEH